MEKIKINGIEYELVDDYRDAFNLEELNEALTDYYIDFDYIVGDWAYNKLRLKGFFDKKNTSCRKYNDIENLNKYLECNCAYGCKWFRIKKIAR